MTNTNRLNWVDLSKGFGIILVVYGHVTRGLDSAGLSFDLFQDLDNAIYAFHMPLFFILSGYFFIMSTKKGINKYVKSKVSVILYPYLLWSLIQIIIQFFASNYTNGKVVLNDIITFFIPRGQFWFLLALFFISIINVFLYHKTGKLGLFISMIISFFYYLGGFNIRFIDHIMSNLLFYNLGLFLFLYSDTVNKVILGRVWFLLNTLFFLMFQLLLYNNFFESNFFNFFIAISGSLFVIQLFNQKTFQFKHLKELGSQSMIIYILHILIASGTRIFLKKIFNIDNSIVHLIIGLLFGIYIPFMLYKFGFLKKINFLFKYQSSYNSKH